MEDITIESLVANGRVVKPADLSNPANDYLIIGVYQNGTNPMKGNGTSYRSYVLSVADVLGGGSVYTASNGVVLIGNDFQLASQNISQFVNNSGYLTAATIGNFGWKLNGNTVGSEKYIGTNDNFALPFRVGGKEVARFTTDGPGQTRMYINSNLPLHGSNAGIQYSTTFANRAQSRFNAYGNHTGIAGITGFKSRGTNIGDPLSVLAGDTLLRLTAIGISGDNASLNLAALIDVKVTAGGVFPAYVATDFTVDLMGMGGVRSEKFRVNHNGTYTVNNIYTFPNVDGLANQVLKTDGLGILTWQSDAAGPIATTAGNTLLTCITDIFVQNVNSCSPLNINASNGQDVLMVAGGGNVGIGTSTPVARTQIKGYSATSGTLSLLVEDIAGTRILSTRDDGITFFGPRYAGISSSNIFSGGEMNFVTEQLFLFEGLIGVVQFEAKNQPMIFRTWHGTAANNEVTFAGRGAAGFESFVRTYDVSTLDDGFKTYIGSSSFVGDTNFRHCFVNGNVHIGYDEVVNSNTTKLTIRSRNALAADNNLLLQDNTSATLLKVRNDGSMNAPLIPTSGTGSPPGGTVSGDLWVDTSGGGNPIVCRVP